MIEYKSPRHKLISFFEKSRNRWKEKYQESKKRAKYLLNRIYFLTRSKDHWKDKANRLEEELKIRDIEYKKQETKLLQENADLKKKHYLS